MPPIPRTASRVLPGGGRGRYLSPMSETPALPPSPPAPIDVPHALGRYAVVTAPIDTLPVHLAAAGLAPEGPGAPALVVTDATVGMLYGDRVAALLFEIGWTPRMLTVPAGEASKSLAHLGGLYDAALGLDVPPSRRTPVFVLGGGVVGDLGGLFAATLLRGLPLVHLPTTLLAMVDSSVGGKTGLNHARGKNLIGTTTAPRLVLADPAFLATLDAREFAAGLAEAVKHALIADADAVGGFEATLDRVLARDADAVDRVVRAAQAVKARVVAEDEFETGVRAHLNFGHTFGHAFEALAGYDGTLLHGEAVAHGMRCAIALSAHLGTLSTDDAARLDALVARLPAAPLPPMTADAAIAAMATDKKRGASGLRFVVLDGVGRAAVRADVPDTAVRAALAVVGVE